MFSGAQTRAGLGSEPAQPTCITLSQAPVPTNAAEFLKDAAPYDLPWLLRTEGSLALRDVASTP